MASSLPQKTPPGSSKSTRRNGHRTLATSTPVTDTRIALYLRVSSDEQTDRKTIDAQRDFLHPWASLYDFPIAGVYADDGISGTIPLHERPDGARLLQDAQAGCFGAVVVYRVDRLARSLRVLLDAHNVLKAAGVAVKSATEPFDSSTPLDKFLFQLLGSMAELERATIIERMNLGRDRVTRQERWMHGPVPLGYQLDDAGCLVPSMWLVEPLGITEATLVSDLYQRLAEVEQELGSIDQESATLQQQLDALRTQTAVTTVIREQYLKAEQMLERLQAPLRAVETTNDRELQRQLIADVVAQIVVEPDAIRLRYHFTEECVATLPNDYSG